MIVAGIWRTNLHDLNSVELSALIVERGVLRYTPAGIPMFDCVLEHASNQQEAGLERQVMLHLAAIAAGKVAEQLNAAVLGSAIRFRGFLAQRRRNSNSVVFHITAFEIPEISN